MQVSVETIEGLERRMTVAVPADRIDSEVRNRLNSLSQRVRISGFRPGKAPISVIKQQYGQQVNNEVLSELVQNTFYEAVSQEKLRLAGFPRIEPKDRKVGDPLEYVAIFEVYPEVKLTGLDKVSVEKPQVEISEQDVNNTIDKIRAQRKQWHEVDRASENGDQATIDFKGFIDGTPFAGGEAEDFVVELGVGRMLGDFESNLLGKKAGEETAFDVNFPEDYFGKDIAGKTARFEVKVKKVEASGLAEVNEEFIKSMGIAEGTLDAFTADIRKNMERELQTRIRATVKKNVMDAVAQQNTFELPKSLIDREIENLTKRYSGADKDSAEVAGQLESEARRRVSLGLIFSEVIKEQAIKAESREVRESIEDIASTYERPEEVVQWYYADKQRLEEVESLVLENKAVDWLLNNVKVKEVKQTFDQMMDFGSN